MGDSRKDFQKRCTGNRAGKRTGRQVGAKVCRDSNSLDSGNFPIACQRDDCLWETPKSFNGITSDCVLVVFGGRPPGFFSISPSISPARRSARSARFAPLDSPLSVLVVPEHSFDVV